MKLADLQRSLDAYLKAVRIETDGDPQPFTEVADDWQHKAIAAIAPAVESLVLPGRKNTPEPSVRRCWWVRPRGHAKTADAAMLVAWVLAFSRRRRRGVWVAADKEQGCEGLDSIATLCRHNPWLGELLTIRTDKVENLHTGSVLHFTTSDVSSAFGWKDCDLFTFDEITHWKTNGEQLWAAMYSASGKRKNAIVFALMNAGMNATWQRKLRDTAAQDPSWAFSELPDAVASWIDQDRLRDQHKYLPQAAFDRLWRNRWSSGSSDVLDPADIDAAFDPSLAPMAGKEPGWFFAAGVDLALKRHCAAVVTLAVPNDGRAGRIRLADAKLWRPSPGSKIDLMAIESYILHLDARLGLEFCAFDPWNCELLASRIEADTRRRSRNNRRRYAAKPFMREIPPSPVNLREQASLTIEYFGDRRFQLYDYPPLRHDLSQLQATEKSYGVRLTSPEDETGHGDTFSAFALALLVAHELAGKKKVKLGVFGSDDLGSDPMASVRRLAEKARRDAEADWRDLRKGDELAEGMWMPSTPGVFAPKPVPRDAPRPGGELGLPFPT